jgi:hypothetical protein
MLLQGDGLSVQLFIGAAALTALSVAMTQAGWTHKWFVRGMFALAALLSISSIGWPFLQTRIPMINDALQSVASGRIGWFFVGITPAFVSGMLLSDWLRRRREGAKGPTKWLPVDSALDTLARQDLLDRYQYLIRESNAVFEMKEASNGELSKLEGEPDPLTKLEQSKRNSEIAKLKRRIHDLGAEFDGWTVTQGDCRSAMCFNVQSQLRSGALVAKGFLAPHTPGAVERIIPTEEWRFLSLDCQADQALGPNFEYIALLIGKPRP